MPATPPCRCTGTLRPKSTPTAWPSAVSPPPASCSRKRASCSPAFAPVRFDTTFFVAHLPPGQDAHLIPGELDHAEWLSAEAMLRRWERGECLVSPPTVMTLDAVRGRAADEAPTRLGPLLERL